MLFHNVNEILLFYKLMFVNFILKKNKIILFCFVFSFDKVICISLCTSCGRNRVRTCMEWVSLYLLVLSQIQQSKFLTPVLFFESSCVMFISCWQKQQQQQTNKQTKNRCKSTLAIDSESHRKRFKNKQIFSVTKLILLVNMKEKKEICSLENEKQEERHMCLICSKTQL